MSARDIIVGTVIIAIVVVLTVWVGISVYQHELVGNTAAAAWRGK